MPPGRGFPRGSTGARYARPAAWPGCERRRAVGRLRHVDYGENRATVTAEPTCECASDVDPELISMSMNDLRAETRIPVGPYPNAIAAVPKLRWVVLTAGFAEDQDLVAVDMNTQRVIFKAALRGDSSGSTARSNDCGGRSEVSNLTTPGGKRLQ